MIFPLPCPVSNMCVSRDLAPFFNPVLVRGSAKHETSFYSAYVEERASPFPPRPLSCGRALRHALDPLSAGKVPVLPGRRSASVLLSQNIAADSSPPRDARRCIASEQKKTWRKARFCCSEGDSNPHGISPRGF